MQQKLQIDSIRNVTDYQYALQLYYICKAEARKEARLPLNDFRRPAPKKKASLITHSIKQVTGSIIAVKKALKFIALPKQKPELAGKPFL